MAAPHTLQAFAGQLGDHLCASGDVWTRAAWCREGEDTWHLRLLEIIDGERPSDAEVHEWAYPAVSFFAEPLPGEEVGSWLQGGKVTRGEGWEHPINQPTDRLNWERRESYAQSGCQVLEWPSYEVQLGHLQTK